MAASTCPSLWTANTPTPAESGRPNGVWHGNTFSLPPSYQETPAVVRSVAITYTRAACKKAVKKAARLAGINKRVTCHTFRHSFATVRLSVRPSSRRGLTTKPICWKMAMTPLVLWHLVLYGLSTGPRDKGSVRCKNSSAIKM